MIYGDSSFLIALYRQGDALHAAASKTMVTFKQPIAYTRLAELELHNGVQRCFAAGLVGRAEHDAIFRQIAHDEADGLLVRSFIADSDLYSEALALSRKFTPQISARSLDILHVAAALTLHISPFVSFDAKQRLLAQKVGLPLLPRTLSAK